jgi:hypothetical protein
VKNRPLHEEAYLYALALGFALAVIVVVIAVKYSAASRVEDSSIHDISNVERFAGTSKKADYSIIMLGNSRLRHAIRTGFTPDDYLILENGQKLAVLQYAINGAQFKDFVYMTDDILRAQPDYLLIVDSVISNARSMDNIGAILSKIVFEHLTGFLTGRDPQQYWQQERAELVESCYGKYTREMVRARIKTTRERDSHSLDPAVNENVGLVRDFIRQALTQKIKVIILTLPPNLEILEQHKIPVYMLDFYGLGYVPTPEQLLPELHDEVLWWNYVHPFGKENYCDFVHLNEEGQPIFEKWFLGKIQELHITRDHAL